MYVAYRPLHVVMGEPAARSAIRAMGEILRGGQAASSQGGDRPTGEAGDEGRKRYF